MRDWKTVFVHMRVVLLSYVQLIINLVFLNLLQLSAFLLPSPIFKRC